MASSFDFPRDLGGFSYVVLETFPSRPTDPVRTERVLVEVVARDAKRTYRQVGDAGLLLLPV